MAALVEGCQYGLASSSTENSRNSQGKTLIFVKLTDSSIKAIEDFVKLKNATARKASISFQGNQGSIHIPNLRQDSTHNFGFNISSLDKDVSMQQGSFDCARQSGNRQLETVGQFVYKMQIHANEDSYEKTRVKMATAEIESKKNCTKVIKFTDKTVNRKVKLKRPGGVAAVVTPSSPTYPVQNSIHRNASQPNNNNNRISDVSSNLNNSMSRDRELERVVDRPLNTGPIIPMARDTPITQPSSLNISQPSIPSNQQQQQQQTSNPIKNQSPAQSNKARFNNDILKRSYRERLIHLLAVKSYKKPELLARIARQGVKENEKKGTTSLLSQIASLNQNAYHLTRFAWNEVHEDEWPFYTPEEREAVKKNRASLSDETTIRPGPGPTSQSRVSPSANVTHPQQQQPANNNSNINNVNIKDSSISHSNANNIHATNGNCHPHSNNNSSLTPSSSSVVSSDSGFHSSNSASPAGSHVHDDTSPASAAPPSAAVVNPQRDNNNKEREREVREREKLKRVSPMASSAVYDNDNVNSNGQGGASSAKRARVSLYNPAQKKSPPISPPIPSNPQQAPTRNPAWGTMGSTGSSYCQSSPECVSPNSQDYKSTGSSPSGGDAPEFMSEYAQITNVEQRHKYKTDFVKEYPQYRELHRTLEKVSKRFIDLENTLRRCELGSDEFRKIAQEIMAEYQKSKNDCIYQDAKRKFQYLHQKLGYIKQLVSEYDTRAHS